MKITELTYKMTIDGDASNRDFRADLEAEILECAQRVADDHGLDVEIQAVEEMEERQVPHPEAEAMRRPHYPSTVAEEIFHQGYLQSREAMRDLGIGGPR